MTIREAIRMVGLVPGHPATHRSLLGAGLMAGHRPAQPRPLTSLTKVAGPTKPRHLQQWIAFPADNKRTPIGTVVVAGLLEVPFPTAVLRPLTFRHGVEEEVLIDPRVLPTLKLDTYNGSTCFKTFLAKFENCSDYYDWDDRERFCHLRDSLEGPAGQVLWDWDAGQQSSVEVITLLKNRFGSLNEEERHRSELKARRRRRGESLQSVYQDIPRLMALAFPGQSGPL